MPPDRLLEVRTLPGSHTAIDLQNINRTPRIAAQHQADSGVLALPATEVAHVRMRNGGAQNEANIEMAVRVRCRDATGGVELHHNIRVFPLRTNEVAGIRLAFFQLIQYLCRHIPPLRGVPLDLPHPSQVLRWLKEYLDVIKLPHHGRVESEQAFDDHEFPGLDILRTDEHPGGMVVNGLENWLAVMQALQLQFQNVEIVTIRMERRNAACSSLGSVVFVIVVGANVSHVFGTEQIHQSLRQRRFARRTVANDAQHNRPLSRHIESFVSLAHRAAASLPARASSSGPPWNTLLWRISRASIRASSSFGMRPPCSTRRTAWRSLVRSMALRTLRALAK